MALFRWLPASPGVWGGDVVESGGGAEGGGGGGWVGRPPVPSSGLGTIVQLAVGLP